MQKRTYILFLLSFVWGFSSFSQTTYQTPREQVLKQLQSVHSTNRQASIQQIKSFGSNAVPVLIEVIGYKQQKLDEWYDQAYRKAPPLLQKSMSKPDIITTLRSQAAYALHMIPETKNYLRDLLPLMNDERMEVRRAAGGVFLMHGRQAPLEIKLELIPSLKDDDWYVRSYIIHVLSSSITNLPRAKTAIESALMDSNENVRTAAGEALLQHEKNHPAALSVIRSSMKSTNDWVRVTAAGAYISAYKGSPTLDQEVGPVLNGILSGRNSQPQAMTLMLLQHNGKGLKSTVPEVQKLLTNTNAHIRSEATNALRALTNSLYRP
ncbi:MAG: hypothetical protein K0Q55_2634 [Verrucomicrobia bacterium]|jgi:HEAT repeat protein|nr:hypothetical protein [Verrucomicrobiota bacterium]